jgi:hypothetical protein
VIGAMLEVLFDALCLTLRTAQVTFSGLDGVQSMPDFGLASQPSSGPFCQLVS